MAVIETIKVTYRINIFVYVTFAEKLLFRVAKHCVFVTGYDKTTAKDNAMVYRKELERIHRELTERYEDLKNEMQKLPEGELMCIEQDGVQKYLQRIPATGNRKKEHRYGVKRDRVRLEGLVRKEYVTKALRVLEHDIHTLEMAVKRYKPSDENSVMKDFSEKYPELAASIYNDGFDIEKWKADYERKEDLYPESLKQTAADGSKRRSLGELIIGSRLNHYGIPFRFEAEIDHPDIPYVPDFTIIRPRDGKIIYWEHLGDVNNQTYLNNNKHKFDVYERYGIVPWDNLIISFSQKDYGINEKLIDNLIQGWLL